jgi:hypothetical protein
VTSLEGTDRERPDTYRFTKENIHAQLRTAPFALGCYTLKFYTENGRPVDRTTQTVEEFFLSPSGGTLRDGNFNIVFYDSQFDKYRGFRPPHLDRLE